MFMQNVIEVVISLAAMVVMMVFVMLVAQESVMIAVIVTTSVTCCSNKNGNDRRDAGRNLLCFTGHLRKQVRSFVTQSMWLHVKTCHVKVNRCS